MIIHEAKGPIHPEDVVGEEDAASIAGVSTSVLRRLRTVTGQGPKFTKVNSRTFVYKVGDVLDWKKDYVEKQSKRARSANERLATIEAWLDHVSEGGFTKFAHDYIGKVTSDPEPEAETNPPSDDPLEIPAHLKRTT